VGIEALLLSSSRVYGGERYLFAADVIREFFGGCGQVYFAPYAVADHAEYTQQVAQIFDGLGLTLRGLPGADARAAVGSAQGILVGGGNSFRLLKTLQARGLIEVIRERVRSGQLRYMGVSAGSNMACPTLRTTNDMPIVQPASFEALGIIPFQINPHYVDPDPDSRHMGETREDRIREFLEENDVAVLGLREGAWLRLSGEQLALGGVAGARLFVRGADPQELEVGADLSWLLRQAYRFDVPSGQGVRPP
jgi:dipeptidase E